jgi:ATP-dependent DNA helicase RecG
MPLRALIDKLIAEKTESEWLEFKINKYESQLIGEYLSALSNSACLYGRSHGYLVFGIADKTHDVVGTNFAPTTEKGKGNEGLEPWLARHLSPRVDFKISEYNYDGKHVVVFKVDATANTPVRFQQTAFIRVGEHKHRLQDYPEKERKIWEKAHASDFESGMALENQTPDDVLAKIDYPAFFDLLKIPLPDNRKGILEKLEEENVILNTMINYAISNMGAILFAKNLDSFPSLVRKAVRVVIYDDDNRYIAKKEQTGSKGYAVGFESLVEYISDQLPANELIKDALRIEHKMYPPEAIREFVANALIHQDFSIRGAGPIVEIFKTRLEITNPGKSLVKSERLIDHAPKSRNEKLARLMRRMNICEERGSGIDRALSKIEGFQLPAPDFLVEDDYTRVIVLAYRELKDMDSKDKLRACYQHAVLRWVCRDLMTNATLRDRLGIDEKNYSIASRIIKDALKVGIIKVSDPENMGTKKKYVPFWV